MQHFFSLNSQLSALLSQPVKTVRDANLPASSQPIQQIKQKQNCIPEEADKTRLDLLAVSTLAAQAGVTGKTRLDLLAVSTLAAQVGVAATLTRGQAPAGPAQISQHQRGPERKAWQIAPQQRRAGHVHIVVRRNTVVVPGGPSVQWRTATIRHPDQTELIPTGQKKLRWNISNAINNPGRPGKKVKQSAELPTAGRHQYFILGAYHESSWRLAILQHNSDSSDIFCVIQRTEVCLCPRNRLCSCCLTCLQGSFSPPASLLQRGVQVSSLAGPN